MSALRRGGSSRHGSAHEDMFDSNADQSESDKDHVDDARPRKRSRKGKQYQAESNKSKARTKANVASLATDTAPNMESASDRLSKVDGSVLARIKKALALAQHEGTGEQEAKAALRMATKLMSQHSVNQADVLAAEDETQRMKRAGMSVVSITSLFRSAVRLESWISTVAQAMTVFFDCKVYSTTFSGGTRLEWTFYGLAEHTVAAAYAFEMAYNLILEWSQAKKAGQGRREKTTYRIGVGDGLYSLAKREKKEEKQRTIETEKHQLEAAQRAEEEEDRARLNRLDQPATVSALLEQRIAEDSSDEGDKKQKVKIEESDDKDIIRDLPSIPVNQVKNEHENVPISSPNSGLRDQSVPSSVFQPDFDDSDDDIDLLNLDAPEPKYQPQVRATQTQGTHNSPEEDNNVRPSPPARAREQNDDDEEAQWKSLHQLVAFRETSVAIADGWLKAQDLKLTKGRKRTVRELQSRREAQLYEQGKEDAKKIDVRRKRIKGKEDDY